VIRLLAARPDFEVIPKSRVAQADRSTIYLLSELQAWHGPWVPRVGF